VEEIERDTNDLASQLDDQIRLLKSSADAFDQGETAEAKRLALGVRILVHDTGRSRSLLTLLGRKANLLLLDTAIPVSPSSASSHFGLAMVAAKTGGGGTPIAFLDGGPRQPSLVRFQDWWNGVVFVDSQGRSFSRQDLVLIVADQDGGAHVDPKLESDYIDLTRRNSLGWRYGHPATTGSPLPDFVPASIRQIAHEVIRTLDTSYTKQMVQPDDCAFIFGGVTFHQGLSSPDTPPLPDRNSTKVGRNDPCSCGSGKKFKKCCGSSK